MEPICLCGLIRTWRDEVGDPWREMLGAEHVPGIRGPQSVLLNSRLGLCKPCKHILKDTRLQHKHVHFNRSTWKIWAQKANMRWNAECGSKWISTIDQDRNQLFVYMPSNQNHELSGISPNQWAFKAFSLSISAKLGHLIRGRAGVPDLFRHGPFRSAVRLCRFPKNFVSNIEKTHLNYNKLLVSAFNLNISH